MRREKEEVAMGKEPGQVRFCYAPVVKEVLSLLL